MSAEFLRLNGKRRIAIISAEFYGKQCRKLGPGVNVNQFAYIQIHVFGQIFTIPALSTDFETASKIKSKSPHLQSVRMVKWQSENTNIHVIIINFGSKNKHWKLNLLFMHMYWHSHFLSFPIK